MRHRHLGLLALGLVLVLVGLVGMSFVLSRSDDFIRYDGIRIRRSGTDASLGTRIFFDGLGEDGVVPRSATGPGRMGGGCADCHGADGRGGSFRMMMGSFETPDITYDAPTSEHGEDDGHDAHEGWDAEDIRRAVTDGVEPDGEALDPFSSARRRRASLTPRTWRTGPLCGSRSSRSEAERSRSWYGPSGCGPS